MDASINGIFDYPAISIGYNYNDILFTFKTDVSLMTLLSRKVGNTQVEDSKDRLVSTSSMLAIEQPFINGINVLIAFKINYSKYYYQSWLAFVTTKNWILIPEFHVGVNLW